MTQQSDVLLEVKGLVKHFPLRRSLKEMMRGELPVVRAVDRVDFFVLRGEIFGLVGESGSGKTTTGRNSFSVWRNRRLVKLFSTVRTSPS